MRATTILAILATFLTSFASASTLSESLFSKANTSYVAGENATDANVAKASYKEAADNYRAAIDAGDISWAAYYNLGNAFYKLGDYGNAVLAYERARAIDPLKPETAANMAAARQAATLPPTREHGRIEAWGLRLPMSAWMWGGAIGAWAFVAALILPMLHGGHKLGTLAALVASLALTAACFAGMMGWHFHAKWQVVTTPNTEMRAAPDAKATTIRSLIPATNVMVMRASESWVFVRTEQNDEGWIPAANASSAWEKTLQSPTPTQN